MMPRNQHDAAVAPHHDNDSRHKDHHNLKQYHILREEKKAAVFLLLQVENQQLNIKEEFEHFHPTLIVARFE